jgi:hypothetical protein
VKRSYRIEINAINGVKLDFIDISNELELQEVVGKAGLQLHFPSYHNSLDIYKIFDFIVHQRMTIKLGIKIVKDEYGEKMVILDYLQGISILKLERDELISLIPRAFQTGHRFYVENNDFTEKSIEMAFTGNTPLESYLENIFNSNDTPFLRDLPVPKAFTPKPATPRTIEATIRSKSKRLIIISKRITLAGKYFKTVVLLREDGNPSKSFNKNPNYYFTNTIDGKKNIKSFENFSKISILFCSTEIYTGKKSEFIISGAELHKLHSPEVSLDLSTRFRRDKFGAYLLLNLCVTYSSDGELTIDYLPNMVKE